MAAVAQTVGVVDYMLGLQAQIQRAHAVAPLRRGDPAQHRLSLIGLTSGGEIQRAGVHLVAAVGETLVHALHQRIGPLRLSGADQRTGKPVVQPDIVRRQTLRLIQLFQRAAPGLTPRQGRRLLLQRIALQLAIRRLHGPALRRRQR